MPKDTHPTAQLAPVNDGEGGWVIPIVYHHVIGEVTVHVDGTGPTAYEAAFTLIGREASAGTYEFPSPDGGICRVEVAYLSEGEALR